MDQQLDQFRSLPAGRAAYFERSLLQSRTAARWPHPAHWYAATVFRQRRRHRFNRSRTILL